MMRGRARSGQRSIGVAIMLVCWLLLAACGQTGSGQADGSAAADPNAPVSNSDPSATTDPNAPVSNTDPSATTDPNAPVTGFPGQPGGPATGALVQGRVTNAAGQPVAGVLVVPQSTDSPAQPIPEIAVLTDEQGRYQWSLPPGGYTLSFNAEGYTSAAQPVTVVTGQTTTLDVTLQQP